MSTNPTFPHSLRSKLGNIQRKSFPLSYGSTSIDQSFVLIDSLAFATCLLLQIDYYFLCCSLRLLVEIARTFSQDHSARSSVNLGVLSCARPYRTHKYYSDYFLENKSRNLNNFLDIPLNIRGHQMLPRRFFEREFLLQEIYLVHYRSFLSTVFFLIILLYVFVLRFFSHDPNAVPFQLKGKTTAIVGGTGSGKSTIAKLLLRLNDVSNGQIKFAGTPITEMNQETLRSYISYVPQKAFLFSGTIRSNLLMGNEHATDEELTKAIRIAQLDEVLENLPDQLDSFVAQGGDNYSGGQKQRMCIARALVKSAEIYVFDDSFSALDYRTDAKLRGALQREMADKTLIIIAQRLSTIINADNIIVLDEGRIVGQGTHEELLKNNRSYQEFAKSQGMLKEGVDGND